VQNRSLCGLAFVQQCVVNVAAFFSLSLQASCPTEVSLISENNQKFRFLAIGCVFSHPRRNFPKLQRNLSTRRSREGGLVRYGERAYESDASSQKKQ